MAKRTKANGRTKATGTKRPRSASLPGMEDHAIKPLERLAHEYADIRDRRMELTEQEHSLKQNALKLMEKYGKTVYHHDGVTITVIEGDRDVKVRVKKATDGDDADADTPAAGGGEFGAERRAAVEAGD